MASIFLKIDGIDGDATHDKHKNWIEVHSASWGLSRSAFWSTGSGKNRESGTPTLSDVMISKATDKSSPKLFQMSTTGDATKGAEIHIIQTGDPGETYLVYKLSDILITNFQWGGSDGSQPSEHVSINFHKFEIKYVPFDEKNKAQSPVIAKYDMATGKAG